MFPPVILQVFIIFNILLAKRENLSKICGMANFDEHLEQQLNQRDDADDDAESERKAENFRELKKELQRLNAYASDLEDSIGDIDCAEACAASARLIASYADAIQ